MKDGLTYNSSTQRGTFYSSQKNPLFNLKSILNRNPSQQTFNLNLPEVQSSSPSQFFLKTNTESFMKKYKKLKNQEKDYLYMNRPVKGVKMPKNIQKVKLTPIVSRRHSKYETSLFQRQIDDQSKGYNTQRDNSNSTLKINIENLQQTNKNEEYLHNYDNELEEEIINDLPIDQQVKQLYKTIQMQHSQKHGQTQSEVDQQQPVFDLDDMIFRPEFNIRQVNYLFVRAVESKFNDDLKPQYIKDMEAVQQSSIQQPHSHFESIQNIKANAYDFQQNDPTDVKNMKGFKKSEYILQELKKQLKQKEIEKRQGMKVDEHSQRLATFANEVDQKFHLNENELKSNYQVSIRQRRTDEKGKAMSTIQALRQREEEQQKSQSPLQKKAKLTKKQSTQLGKDVKDYYLQEDNFQDDLPYDLYNMVELYKQISKQQVLPNFQEIKNEDLKNMNILMYGQDGSNTDSRSIKQFVSKYKHKMEDMNTKENREFIEKYYKKVQSRRMHGISGNLDSQKAQQEQSNSSTSGNISIEKYNGHYGLKQIKQKLRQKEIDTLENKLQDKLISDYLPYYHMKSVKKKPQDLIRTNEKKSITSINL
eukprot:403330810